MQNNFKGTQLIKFFNFVGNVVVFYLCFFKCYDVMNIERNESHIKAIWKMKTKVENEVFDNYDFTETNFNHPVFKKVIFENCVFNKSNINDARFYSCNFKNCHFKSIDFSNTTIGAHGGTYENCIFEKCNFRGASVYLPEFLKCKFDNCKLKKIDFHASYFYECKFIGKLSEVVFNKEYISDITLGAKPNPMYKVDFSEATFDKYVIFNNCDLSTCLPPKGTTFDKFMNNEY